TPRRANRHFSFFITLCDHSVTVLYVNSQLVPCTPLTGYTHVVISFCYYYYFSVLNCIMSCNECKIHMYASPCLHKSIQTAMVMIYYSAITLLGHKGQKLFMLKSLLR